MSETQDQTTEAAKVKKAPAEVTKVTMTDGREVEFVGKRKMQKELTLGEHGHVTAIFDFVNGETKSATIKPSDKLYARLAGHGLLQKVGDEAAGIEDVGDMVVAIEAMLSRLASNEWGAERKAGDGFSGASVVVRAIMEASGKDQAFVKAFLEKKLEEGKAGGLTRQKLYASFKAPGTKTAAIIERLEKEKVKKDVAVDADAALNEMMG